MSQPLPLQNFQWVDPDIDATQIPDDSPCGYILEVDLEYPQHLHDAHSDLPLAPESMPPPGCKEKRLLTTLHHKTKYVLHYRNLKQYLALGLILTKIHRVLKFDQSPWLRPYIDLNTLHRTNSQNDFEKNFFKLMNNAIFGKTMEQIRNRRTIKLTGDEKRAEKWIALSNFQDRTIFSETLVAFHMRKTVLTFNKPITVGMSILDMSKTLMYDFHYTHMKSKYGQEIRLLYTDTDSFIYHIRTQDVYEDMKLDLNLYDTSDYSPSNSYKIPLINKKVLGKMKDENHGSIMTEFVGLRSKMYAYRVEGKVSKRLKGVKTSVVDRTIELEDYKRCLFENSEQFASMNNIRSQLHVLYSVTSHKLALSPFDRKRHILEDRVSTLAFGHYSIL